VPFYARLPELHRAARELPFDPRFPELAHVIDRLVGEAITGDESSAILLRRAQAEAERVFA
jgi:multiple sugar transport system substrate-binding protein